MPQNINQPANRISLTNISLVRLKKGKKRFEIACYKNKLLEYRSGLETDLDNVLQVPTVFLSVSKGQTAPKDDLVKAFGKGTGNDDIIVEILKKGEVQVGAGERKELLERIEREVVELVSQRLVDPETKRVYTTGMIRKALDLLSRQAGQMHQGALPSEATRNQLNADAREGEGGSAEEEQAGYMGLGKLDINDDYDDHSSTSRSHKNKKSSTKKSSKNTTTKPKPKDNPDSDTDTDLHHHHHQETPPTTTMTTDNTSQTPTWTGVSTTKPPKALALEAMKALIYHQPIPCQRARMRLRVNIPLSIAKTNIKLKPVVDTFDSPQNPNGPPKPTTSLTLKSLIQTQYFEQIESDEFLDTSGGDWEITGFVEPGVYKGLTELIGSETKGRGRVEVLDMAVKLEED
ncbi:hypothetical protein UCRPC4_g03871 [Phaeomoniella chlamydospora]|uniref:Uncharacterized protein n=1 Tax=Phaeomoniella chlamydospora TaxID=158046 RepID=A0A0G2EFN6_PHACM|nr:hypothetical protein UCRPC4_g03871 [Phaeomoniella chlamydospora]